MTNPVILKLRVEKQKLIKQQNELEIKIARLFNELSGYCCTFYEDIYDLEAEKIEQIGDDILETKLSAVKVKEAIKKITKSLGE